MNQVFKKTSIAGLVLKNRILHSATLEGMKDNAGSSLRGAVQLVDHY
jgi:2,4-dienoyl-CoA reductase-like NADH-dependent reductase (Old Yellow Enzyme family)